MSRPRLIVVGPLPPPVHGVTVSTGLVLANPRLRERFDVEHLDTSDHRDGTNVGRWDMTNVRIGVMNVIRLMGMLRGSRGVLYLPISQSSGAFLRDSFFIRLAQRCWVACGNSPSRKRVLALLHKSKAAVSLVDEGYAGARLRVGSDRRIAP